MTEINSANPLPVILAAAAGQLRVEYGGYSSAGSKSRNEDAFAACVPVGSALQLKGVSACIADGVSCSAQAQLASATAVTYFLDDYYSTPDSWPVKTAAARVLAALNSWLYHHDRQNLRPQDGLVTTFSAVIIKSTTAHIFHAGDSRIYRYRDGKLLALTRDHSHRQRQGVVVLTRALGIDSHLEVDYSVDELQRGDVLMLSTDGVHETLSGVELAALLATPGDSLELSARAIVGAALQKGSSDNASCLLLRIDSLAPADIDEVHRQLTRLAIPPVLQPGHRIDGLQVLRVLHSGTRSHIYLVCDMADQRRYALKAPAQSFAEDAQYLEGFAREFWVASRIRHDGVMKVFPRPEQSPFLYLLCEYIEGQTLRQWLYDNPRPSLGRTRGIVRDLIAALRALQRLQMTHRDLKPENILLMADQRVKLIDFGTVQVGGLDEVASPLGTGVPVGSADYIAPEYLLGENGAFHSDIFSLGVIVYEMLTGALPYQLSPQRQRHLRDRRAYRYRPARTLRADIPPWLDLALQKATQPDASLRYQVLSEFMHDLCVPNPGLLHAHQRVPLLRRNPVRFWQGSTLLLLIIVIVLGVRLIMLAS